ncbi:glycosyltransferase family 2 protein [Patescibacteria group bacterium]|nr:glycosyltransferase family 2 protein [Patescibacteria group bacterium]
MISATIITLNEQDSIGKVIESLKGLVSEIIVVDSGSNDQTAPIAKKFGAKVFIRKFDNFANQKNFAVSKATRDWILSLDADEEIAPALTEEIKQAVKSDKFSGYLIPRKNIILGKLIKYSRWSPDLHVWLWKKNCGRWIGDVHEEVIVTGKVGLLKNSKIHNSHKTVSSFIKANNFYSTLEAQSLLKNKIKFSFLKMLMDPFFEFLIRFVYKKGFLDGSRGFVLAYLMSIYKLAVWIKFWELEKKR